MSIHLAGGTAGGEHFVATMLSTIADATGVPSDPGWHDSAVLVAELATLNRRLSRYITDLLDADAKRRGPVDPAVEAALGRALVDLGQRLGRRAASCSPADGAAAS